VKGVRTESRGKRAKDREKQAEGREERVCTDSKTSAEGGKTAAETGGKVSVAVEAGVGILGGADGLNENSGGDEAVDAEHTGKNDGHDVLHHGLVVHHTLERERRVRELRRAVEALCQSRTSK
jgi:hypothetical protein